MTPEHEKHLQSIKDSFLKDVDLKYRKGAKEHGGKLWKKKNIIDMLMEECVDFYVYGATLKQQLEEKGVELGELDE